MKVTCVLPVLSEVLEIGLEVNDHETSSYYNSQIQFTLEKGYSKLLPYLFSSL